MVSSTPSYSTSQYLQQAQKAIDKFEYELAVKILKRAFEQDSLNSFISFSIATCLLELDSSEQSQEAQQLENDEMAVGEEEGEAAEILLDSGSLQQGAKDWLELALKNFDDSMREGGEEQQVQRWQIYLSLAQLSAGEKAVEYYEASVADVKKVSTYCQSQESANQLIIRFPIHLLDSIHTGK